MTAPPPLIVAIDGPSGVGKSTVARGVASRLGLPYLETGAMYRALGWKVLDAGLDPADRDAVEGLAARLDLEFDTSADGEARILLDGRPVSERIREPRVSEATSQVAVYPGVRRRMVRLQRSFATRRGAVLEGRDIGTQVFPATPHKFFLEARTDVRVERRLRQLRARGRELAPHEVQAEITARDERDTRREASPLTKDATYTPIDTSEASADEIVERIASQVLERSSRAGLG
jgi:cytidylate kinase